MLIQQAEDSFRRGLLAMRTGRRLEALAFFETAAELEKRLGSGEVQARYLSYLGLCLVLSRRDPKRGQRLCRAAAKAEAFNADVYWNYGRVLLSSGRRRAAHKQLLTGLKIDREHRGIREDLRRMGVRKQPVLRFLKRGHPLNVMLGRMRYACQARAVGNAAPRAA